MVSVITAGDCPDDWSGPATGSSYWVGTEARVKTSRRGSGQSLVASCQVPAHTVVTTTPSGGAQSSGGSCAVATFMNAAQILAGIMPPVTRFIGALSSLPTHTAADRRGVKPMNQAFR